MIARALVLGIAATALVACLLPTKACGCPPALGIGIVAGVVRRADGAPAPGALVRTHASIASCPAERSDLVDPGLAIASAAGSYRYQLRAVAPSDTSCSHDSRDVATDFALFWSQWPRGFVTQVTAGAPVP